MSDCIFCKIIAGEIPCAKIYEDENFIAFLDIQPVNLGHTLLVPKPHMVNIFDTPPEIGAGIYPLLTKLATAVRDATGADGINIVQNNEAAAGQEVFHSHVHIIPRHASEPFKLSFPHKMSYETMEAMGELAAKVRGAL